MALVTNVTQQFFICYIVGLVVTFLQSFWSLAACFLPASKLTVNVAVQVAIFFANLIYLVSVTILRFKHSGRVCSGDYLRVAAALETRKTGVLGAEGQFLAIYIVVAWIQVAVLFLVFSLKACLNSQKNSPDKERDL